MAVSGTESVPGSGLKGALDAADLDGATRDRVSAAVAASQWFAELQVVAATPTGCHALIRAATFGFETHGDAVFGAVVRDHTEPGPVRGIGSGGSVADDAAAAREFLLTELGWIRGAHMEAMFASVDQAIVTGRRLTLSERNFLDHELLEASYVADGMTQRDAHNRVHETIPPGANFSPHVIVEFQDRFGPRNFGYWGLTKGGR